MKAIIPSIFFFFVTISSFAQISGKIVDNNNEPLPAVSVLVKGTQKGAETDFDGNFTIKNVSGSKIVVISSIGYKTREVQVVAPKNNLSIVLFEGNELLQEVVLKGRNNTFARKKTAYVSKLPLKDLENANVYSTVTNELLESQITTNVDDALKNATGITKLWEGTGRGGGRGTGFFSSRGFATQPSFVDGVPGYTFSAVDPSYIERIEVIKGPSATLFGSTVTSLGGLINIVTKKPYKGEGGSISYTGGSFNTHRLSVDYNTPLAGENGPYLRINASYLDQGSWQDAGFRNTFFIAPSLTYKVNNRLNFSVGLEVTKTKQTNPTMLFLRRGSPMVSRTIKDLNIDPKKSFANNDLYLTNPNYNARIIGDYKISDEWTSQTIFSGNYSQTEGDYSYLTEGVGGAFTVLQPLSAIPGVTDVITETTSLLQRDVFTRIYDRRDLNDTRFNVQQNFNGDFKIGNVRNRVVIGLDYVNRKQNIYTRSGNPALTQTPRFQSILGILGSFSPQQAQAVTRQLAGFPYFDAFLDAQGNVIPLSITPNATYFTDKANLDANFAQVTPKDVDNFSQTLAVYASDVINITPALTVNIGLRLDHFIQDGSSKTENDNFEATRFSPNAGIVYQPILNELSLFANYQSGFINTPSEFNPASGKIIPREPQKAKQFEGGVKTNLFNGKLNVGASYYHITINDRLITDPDPKTPFPTTLPVEEIVSKGFELEVNANPVDGLNLRASYSKNDSKITDANSRLRQADGSYVTNFIASVQDRRPEEAGAESVYNFWADYKFQEGSFAENFGFGFGFNGASEHLTMNNATAGTFTLPSYTIFNASLYYDADKFRVGFKANNFTDKEYYTGWSTVNPQAPRSFLGTVTYKF